MEAVLTETSKKPITVGIREFRDNLATYLLETNSPVTITRHGDTVGVYIPVRRKRSEADMEALREVHQKLQESMAAAGVTEDDIIEDFERMRKESRNR